MTASLPGSHEPDAHEPDRHEPDGYELRPFSAEEYDAVYDLLSLAFHTGDPETNRESERAVVEFDRTLAVFDGGRPVASAAAYTRQITVPGGPTPVACVTLVSVAPTHTRRGLLTQMMRRQLTELHERGGEPVAALWASESTIYGRFGYGLATRHGRLRCRTHDVRLRTAADPRDRRIRLAPAADETVRGEVAAVHERARRDRVGFVERPGPWTAFALHDPPAERGGATALQVAVHDGEAGVDGYAVYATKREWGVTGPAGEVHVREMVAETPGAYAALWGFLLSVDLTTSLSWGITSPDEPLRHLVETSDHVETSLGDNLWVRVVDLPRALGARRYATDVGLVLEVSDPFCPWNAGRWRVDAGPDGATAARTDEPADLALGATELGAVYLGGTAWATLAAAGRVTELRPGALAEADVAFGVRPAPYCPEVF